MSGGIGDGLANTLRRAVQKPAAVGQEELARALEAGSAGAGREVGSAERRTSGRLGVDLPLRVQPADRVREGAAHGRAHEVGLGGLSARIDRRPRVGEQVRVELPHAATGTALEMGGRVSWVHPRGEGGARVGIVLSDRNAWAWFHALRAMAAAAAGPGASADRPRT